MRRDSLPELFCEECGDGRAIVVITSVRGVKRARGRKPETLYSYQFVGAGGYVYRTRAEAVRNAFACWNDGQAWTRQERERQSEHFSRKPA